MIAIGTGPRRRADPALVLVADQRVGGDREHGRGAAHRAAALRAARGLGGVRPARRPLALLALAIQPVADLGTAGILTITAFGTAVIWIAVMLLTRPEPDEVLDRFYARARPGGPGWRRQRERTGLEPLQDLSTDVWSTVCGVGLVFGAMFAVGGALLLRWEIAVVSSLVSGLSGVLLVRLRARGAEARRRA